MRLPFSFHQRTCADGSLSFKFMALLSLVCVALAFLLLQIGKLAAAPVDERSAPAIQFKRILGECQTNAPSEMDSPLVVRLFNSEGIPVANQVIKFSITSGSGELFATYCDPPLGAAALFLTTDVNGIAWVRFEHPSTWGITTKIVAQAGNQTVNFLSVTPPPPVKGLNLISGDAQYGMPETTDQKPLVVKLLDADDHPIAHEPVVFTVTSGGGNLMAVAAAGRWEKSTDWQRALSVTSLTDAEGLARAVYTHGKDNNTLSQITAQARDSSVTFKTRTDSGNGTYDAPSAPELERLDGARANLTWVNHATSADAVLVELSANDGPRRIIAVLPPDATTYCATNLSPDIDYSLSLASVKEHE